MTGLLSFADGRKQVARRVEAMAKNIQPAVAAAMADWAAHTVGEMKSIVPVRSGVLKESIDYTFGDPPKDARFVARSHSVKLTGTYLRISLFAGSFKAYWARWVEFGTKARAPGSYRDEKDKRRNAGARGHAATRAQPYFWPVWRFNRKAGQKAIAAATKKAMLEGVKVN
jgi:hypothetical protein